MVIDGTSEIFIFGMKIRALEAEGAAGHRLGDPGSGARARSFRSPPPQKHLDVITLHQEGDKWVSGSAKSEGTAYRHKPPAQPGEEPYLYDLSGKPREAPRPSGQIIDLFI